MTIFVTDEMLTAYLDGELDATARDEMRRQIAGDPQLAARLAHFGRADLPYAEAFAAHFAPAPHARLDAMLAAIPVQLPVPAAPPSRWSRRRLMAAGLACLAGGAVLDRGAGVIGKFLAAPDDDARLRGEVAEYMALYTADTLIHTSLDDGERAAQLRFTGDRLGLDLSSFALTLGGLAMRRAQVLQYDGKSLGQILYLDPQHGPLALCILAAPSAPSPIAGERRHGMNVISWATTAHSFVMASHCPPEQLRARGDEVSAALAGLHQV